MNNVLRFAPLVLLAAAFVACPQTSTNGTPTSISLTPSTASIALTKTQTFKASATDTQGRIVTGINFNWASGDTAIATVNDQGVMIGMAVGTTKITVSSGNLSQSANITVTDGTPTGSTFSGTITAPNGGDIKNTEVLACFSTNTGCDKTKSKLLTIAKTGSSAAFNFSSLEAGDYLIGAVKDTNDNGVDDEGDYFGCYGQNGDACALVRPSKAGLDFQLGINGAAFQTIRKLESLKNLVNKH
jgi:Bacterial Ig-like domain (group 2)